MDESHNDRVACPGCSKGYRWTDDMVGKTVSCKNCDTRFEVPAQPGQGIDLSSRQDDIYELDLGEDEAHPNDPEPLAAPANEGHCPSCNNNINEGAVICMNCGFNLRDGEKVQTQVIAPVAGLDTEPSEARSSPLAQSMIRSSQREAYGEEVAADAARQHQWDEFFTPLIIIGVGLFFFLINISLLAPKQYEILSIGSSTTERMTIYGIAYMLTIVFMLPILLAGIFGMVSVFGSSFGNLFTALLKLVALTVLVVAVDQTVLMGLDIITGGFGGIGYLIRFAVLFAVFYPLCMKLFDMESYEIMVMLFLYVIGPIALKLLIFIVLMSMFS